MGNHIHRGEVYWENAQSHMMYKVTWWEEVAYQQTLHESVFDCGTSCPPPSKELVISVDKRTTWHGTAANPLSKGNALSRRRPYTRVQFVTGFPSCFGRQSHVWSSTTARSQRMPAGGFVLLSLCRANADGEGHGKSRAYVELGCSFAHPCSSQQLGTFGTLQVCCKWNGPCCSPSY